MLVPTGGSLVSVPKYLLAFWGASWLFGPVPPFFASSWREIFDAVLADYACADCRLYCTKMAVFPKMLLRAEIQIVNFAGYISVRIRSKAIANGSGLAFNIRISSFRLKNAFMPGYCATSPRPRKVRSAPFPPAAKTLSAPFPAPLPTVRGTAGPPGTELGDGKKQDRRSGPACVSGSAYFKLKNAFIPGYSATSPSSSSMRSS